VPCAAADRLLYWYALVMVLGIFGLLTWQLWPYCQRLVR
jgi:NADH-quinone oxidoreductase subunit L